MVYNNLFLRLFFSIFFILIYCVFLYIDFKLIFYITLLIYFLILFEIYIYFKKYTLVPIIYTLVSLVFFMTIDFNEEIILSFNLFIFTVITFDIFSFIIGKFFGKKKLTKISPNKTYEGLIGGFILSFIIALSFSLFFEIIINIKLLLFIFFIILFSFIGDIIESYFKRKNNIKDSSEFIPGHGGVFDRFDSFLFSIIFYSITVYI